MSRKIRTDCIYYKEIQEVQEIRSIQGTYLLVPRYVISIFKMRKALEHGIYSYDKNLIEC